MSGVNATGGPHFPVVPRDDAKAIRTVSRQLESVFVAQMFAAMRATVPTEGIVSSGSGEEMFRPMLDEKIAAQLPATVHGAKGLAHAIEHSLSSKLARQSALHSPHDGGTP